MNTSRPLTRLAAVATTLAALALPVQLLAPSAPASADTGTDVPAPDVPTTVRISTFNVLGDSHTAPGGDRRGWASGTQRMAWAARIIRDNKFDIVGFQEFQNPQLKAFRANFGTSFGIYPGSELGNAPVQNSIVWNQAKWRLIEKHTIPIPYFYGKPIEMPYLLLENVVSGRRLWVFNSHNPANSAGDAQKWRNQAIVKEATLVKQLQAQTPGIPVVVTGDKNDRARYFCPIIRSTNLHAANGGGLLGSTCVLPPKPVQIDWIMGAPHVSFSGYTALDTALVRRTTDHRVVFADAFLPSQAVTSSPIRHVVAISISGLASGAFRSSRIALPNLTALRSQGASTLNARAEVERVTSLPNLASMITSRAVSRDNAGTGLLSAPTYRNGTNIHTSAGSYVSSVFDSVHDAGLRTGLWTSMAPFSRLTAASWGSTTGALDRNGLDNGRSKISTTATTKLDSLAVRGAIDDLTAHGTAFSFVALSAADKQARAYGSTSSQYRAALEAEDRYVGALVRAIKADPNLNGTTAIIVTADHGGVRQAALNTSNVAAYRVPFLVWGPGVAAGADLYALNPQLSAPGTAQPGYSGPQPLRNAQVANLAVKLLGLPGVSRSGIDQGQLFTVFGG